MSIAQDLEKAPKMQRRPFKEWLRSLDPVDRDAILDEIEKGDIAIENLLAIIRDNGGRISRPTLLSLRGHVDDYR